MADSALYCMIAVSFFADNGRLCLVLYDTSPFPYRQWQTLPCIVWYQSISLQTMADSALYCMIPVHFPTDNSRLGLVLYDTSAFPYRQWQTLPCIVWYQSISLQTIADSALYCMIPVHFPCRQWQTLPCIVWYQFTHPYHCMWWSADQSVMMEECCQTGFDSLSVGPVLNFYLSKS